MASANFKLSSNGGSSYAAAGVALADANALAYAASSTYSIKAALESTAGVDSVAWSITSADDAHAASLPTVTSNADKTCEFVVPKTGGAWLLKCVVNGGVSLTTGATDTTLVKRLAVKVLNESGLQEIAVGETDEAGSMGWTQAWNDVGRAVADAATAGASGYGGDEFWPIAVDGARTESGGGAASALTQPRAYTTLTLSNSTSLNMAGYPLVVTDTLTVGAGCVLHNDGGAGADNSVTGGSGGGTAGQLASANASPGSNGGAATAAGTNGTAVSTSIGGAGGAGGNGSGGAAGGAGGVLTAPVIGTVGMWWTREAIARMAAVNKVTWTALNPGTPGGGGGGSSVGDAHVGCGGGQPGGFAQIRAKNVVLNATGRISCNGGRGGNALQGGGGGGGGGGGYLVIFCDTFTGTYANCTAAGGAAGTSGTGATAAVAGGAGKVLIFCRGRLVYSSGV